MECGELVESDYGGRGTYIMPMIFLVVEDHPANWDFMVSWSAATTQFGSVHSLAELKATTIVNVSAKALRTVRPYETHHS